MAERIEAIEQHGAYMHLLFKLANLYLCGASCHPGPGVMFPPWYGAAYEVAEALGTLTRSSARSAA